MHYYFDSLQLFILCTDCCYSLYMVSWLPVYNLGILLQVVSLCKNGWRQMQCQVFSPWSPELHRFSWQDSVVELELSHSATLAFRLLTSLLMSAKLYRLMAKFVNHRWLMSTPLLRPSYKEPAGASVDCCVQTDNIAAATKTACIRPHLCPSMKASLKKRSKYVGEGAAPSN